MLRKTQKYVKREDCIKSSDPKTKKGAPGFKESLWGRLIRSNPHGLGNKSNISYQIEKRLQNQRLQKQHTVLTVKVKNNYAQRANTFQQKRGYVLTNVNVINIYNVPIHFYGYSRKAIRRNKVQQ